MNTLKFAATRILAIGDIIFDRFEYGKVERVSPEAPVMIFRPVRAREMLGGVGNVVANLAELGCKTSLIAMTGKDAKGRQIAQFLDQCGVNHHLVHQNGIPTIVKTRIISNNDHILRIDVEKNLHLDRAVAKQILDRILKELPRTDVVLISDYAKGLITPELCQKIIVVCNRLRKKVLIDPKGRDYSKYAGAFLLKPNLKELTQATGQTFDPSAPDLIKSVAATAHTLAKRLKLGGMLVTLSEHGMLYVSAKNPRPVHLPTKAREVFDVSGAGDTVIATIAASLGAGFSMEEAMKIANAASGIAVSKFGTATITLGELNRELNEISVIAPTRKIVSTSEIDDLVKHLRKDGKRIGFVSGCFDCCRLNDLHSLKKAKERCDILIVGVSSDKWIRKHKGQDRPIQDELTRTTLLSGLECVDYVVIYGSETVLPLVKRIRPDVLAKN